MVNSNNIINILQITLMIIGAIFIIILLSVPMQNLLSVGASEAATLWVCFKSTWLRPPYLYFIVNVIIVTIAASSRLHPPPACDDAVKVGGGGGGVVEVVKDVEVDEVEESTVDECATWIVSQPLGDDVVVDKLALPETEVVSSRIDRLPTQAYSQGTKLSQVTKQKNPYEYETLESVWKAITEGKPKQPPTTKHTRKKSEDTWTNNSRRINLINPSIRKSETFRDRTNNYSPPHLKREPSLSHDELNQRVEEFITKFNENMRLQRQESLQQRFIEKINRAI